MLWHPLEGVMLTCTYYEASFLLSGAAYKQQNLLKEQKQIRRHLEQEIDNFNLEVNKQRKMIESLEKERDRWVTFFLLFII
jgi:hypothetical protein